MARRAKKHVKNKLCFIFCQDKAFEDKMNSISKSQLRSQYSLQMFIFQLVEVCHQYNKHKTDKLKYVMHCLSFFINKTFLGENLCVSTCLQCLTVATPPSMYSTCNVCLTLYHLYKLLNQCSFPLTVTSRNPHFPAAK